MAYQIYDNGASIRIVSGLGEILLMKHQIVQVLVIGGTTIKIDMGDPNKTIYLNYAEITLPVTPHVVALQDVLNVYISNCVCDNVVKAANGLAVEDGRVMLGENAAIGHGEAALINNRKVVTNGYSLQLQTAPSVNTSLEGGGISLKGSSSSAEGISIPAKITLEDVGDSMNPPGKTTIERNLEGLSIYMNAFGAAFVLKDDGTMSYQGSRDAMHLDMAAYMDFMCNGTLSFLRPIYHLPNDPIPGTQPGNLLFTNKGATGAVSILLDEDRPGCFFTFCVVENFQVQIRARPQIKMRVGPNVLVQGGSIFSETPGSCITLCKIYFGLWMATAVVGDWHV